MMRMIAAGAAVAAALAAPPAAAGAMDETLAAVRQATERYVDLAAAAADGYIRDPNNMCVVAAMEGQPQQLGSMGVHYVRPDLLGLRPPGGRVDGTGFNTDFLTPSVLVYEPQADGTMHLVAVENLVFAKAWHDAGNVAPPEFLGQQYYLVIDNPLTPVDEAHGFEPHYELHVWLYRDNPAGMFSPFNAAATCDHHVHTASHRQ